MKSCMLLKSNQDMKSLLFADSRAHRFYGSFFLAETQDIKAAQ